MSTKAVSSAYGEIKRMLLTYPESNPLPADIILQRYFGIFKALGTNIEYVILAYPETHQAIINTAVNAGLTPENIMLVPAEFSPVVAVRKLIERRPNNGWLAEVDSPQHSIWGMHLTPEAPRSSIRALEDYSRTLGSFKSASPSARISFLAVLERIR